MYSMKRVRAKEDWQDTWENHIVIEHSMVYGHTYSLPVRNIGVKCLNLLRRKQTRSRYGLQLFDPARPTEQNFGKKM